MKHGWEYTSFGDIICPAKNIRNSDGADLPVLSITMHGGIVKQNERFKKVIASRDTANYKVVKRGQLVIAFPIDEGLIYTQEVADKGIMSPAYNVYDIDCTNINRHFLVTFLHSPFAMKYYKDKLRGTTQRRRMLPKEDLYALSIPLPPLPVQEQICSLLDKMNRVIEAKKEQLKELDNLAQAIFYDMFGDPIVNEMGWNKQKFTDVCSVQYGYPFDSNYFTVEKEGLPLVRIRDVVRGYSETYFNGAYPDEYIVHKGDYLIGMDGEFNIAQWQSDNALLNQRVCKIRVKDNKCGVIKYISYFLIRQLKEIEDETPFVTVKHLSAKRINAIFIPVPPLPLQQEFAEKVKAIERQKELINQSIKDVQTLFDAKMDYYFGD